MSLQQLTSIEDVREFLEGTEAATFSVLASKQERYRWIQKSLVTHGYMLLSKAGKGLITRYLIQVTGYSLAQTKRLIRQYTNIGEVKLCLARDNGFQRTYTKVDIKLLARMKYHYKDMMTPYQKFRSLDRASQYLKQGITFKKLDVFATQMNDNDAVEILNLERNTLLKQLHERLIG